MPENAMQVAPRSAAARGWLAREPSARTRRPRVPLDVLLNRAAARSWRSGGGVLSTARPPAGLPGFVGGRGGRGPRPSGPATVVGVPLVHGKSVDPAVSQLIGIRKLEARRELDPQTPENVGRNGGSVRNDENEVALGGAGPSHDRRGPLLAEEFCDRRLDA